MGKKHRVEDESALYVTCHAITRYVQRILGTNIEGVFASSAAQAHAHCAAIGRTLADVRAEIFTPGMKLAVTMRLPTADNGTFIATIDPASGRILTILETRTRGTHRARILSSRELMQKKKARIRKEKRRPVGIAPTEFSDEGE